LAILIINCTVDKDNTDDGNQNHQQNGCPVNFPEDSPV